MITNRKIAVSVTMSTAMLESLKITGNVSATVRDAVDAWLQVNTATNTSQ